MFGTVRRFGWLSLSVLALGCAGEEVLEEVEEEEGVFQSLPDDEALEADDPPTNPDPENDELLLGESSPLSIQKNGAAAGACPKFKAMSPAGLTFVYHVSKQPEEAERAFRHFQDFKGYVRSRDVFMIEGKSPIVTKLRALFPCNRFHVIAYPHEMQNALGLDNVDGVALDWEENIALHGSLKENIERVNDWAIKIRKAGKVAGVVPYYRDRFKDGRVASKTKMEYNLAQIQWACVRGPRDFANESRATLKSFGKKAANNVGLEISLNTFDSAPNGVGAQRAVDCTRAAYGKGARLIYLYGNGPDKFPEYFKGLRKAGLRRAK